VEFDPRNNVVKLCVQGMDMEEKGESEEARSLFLRAWNEATNDFEKFIAAYYVARCQETLTEKLKWLETALRLAEQIDDESVRPAFSSLYSEIAQCQEELGDHESAKESRELAASSTDVPLDTGPFFHGTRADLHAGDLLVAGGNSNYQGDLVMNHIYFTALVNGAGLAAALAKGYGAERVYFVEPTGPFEHDPNVTNKKFPGNPTRSYRSRAPL
jgi:rifampin ADP-ribosylating transferase